MIAFDGKWYWSVGPWGAIRSKDVASLADGSARYKWSQPGRPDPEPLRNWYRNDGNLVICPLPYYREES